MRRVKVWDSRSGVQVVTVVSRVQREKVLQNTVAGLEYFTSNNNILFCVVDKNLRFFVARYKLLLWLENTYGQTICICVAGWLT